MTVAAQLFRQGCSQAGAVTSRATTPWATTTWMSRPATKAGIPVGNTPGNGGSLNVTISGAAHQTFKAAVQGLSIMCSCRQPFLKAEAWLQEC